MFLGGSVVEVLNKCSEPSPERISLSQPLGLLLKYLSHTKKTSLCSSIGSSQYTTVLVISDSSPFGHCVVQNSREVNYNGIWKAY